MNNNININLNININAINESINRLQKVKDNIIKVQESNNNVLSELSNSWNGTVGENVQKELKEHNDRYESIIKELDNKINFLTKNVVELYTKVDLGINNKIDESI